MPYPCQIWLVFARLRCGKPRLYGQTRYGLCSFAAGRFTLTIARSFPEHYPHPVPPAFVNPQQFPFDLRREIVQDRIRSRMHVQCGSDQQQERLLRREFLAWEIAEFAKFAAVLMPGHARPVVNAL